MSEYIVASCKEWHRPGFERFVKNMPGNWRYVNSNEELAAALMEVAPRYIFFLHWSSMVLAEAFEKHECVCFHMTNVPYGRGGSPLQNLILAGATETMVSALRMESAFDAGPVYVKLPMSLAGRAEEIYLRAGDLCWEMIRWLVTEEPTPVPQQGHATVFRRRTPEQSELPKEGGVRRLFDHIRMLDAPDYPLAFIKHGDFLLEFSFAEMDGEVLRARVSFRTT